MVKIMIKSFADKESQHIVLTGKSSRLHPDLIKRAIRRLEYMHFATSLHNLKVPPSNRQHALTGNRQGQYAIAINDQWRICFRFVDGDAYEVKISDYH